MNINASQASFGSVYFKRVFDHNDGIGDVYEYDASVKPDNKGDVYYNNKKACESNAAKNLTNKLEEQGYLSPKQLYMGLLQVLDEVPKVNIHKKKFSKQALAQLNKYKDIFVQIFIDRV